MGNWDVSKPDNDGERELIDRAVKALEAEFATKTCNKQIASKLEDAELARDSEETCNNKQVSCKLVASEDAISRQAVIEHFQRTLDALDVKGDYNAGFADGIEFCINHLQFMPSVTPKQRMGHWISWTDEPVEIKNGSPVKSSWCSECGEWLVASDEYDCNGNFCPNCGAKMVEPQESEDKE